MTTDPSVDRFVMVFIVVFLGVITIVPPTVHVGTVTTEIIFLGLVRIGLKL